MRLPDKKRPGNPILASDWNLLIEAIAARTPRPSPGLELLLSSGGFIYRLRPTAAGESAPAPPCPFGRIVTWVEGEGESAVSKTGILGGLIHCGDQNWNIDNQELNLGADGTWLVSIEVDCEVNRDDDGELLLPGVKTGTKPDEWTRTAWNEGDDYPGNTAPEAETGTGTVVLPIGKLTIRNGSARLEATGCGNFTVTHCAGSLGYTRS